MSQQMLSDFLAGPAMTRLANSEAIKRGLPNFLPPALLQYSSSRPVGMNVQWEQVNGNRQLATLVHHTAPSARRDLPGVTKRFATAVGSKQHFVIDTEMLLALKSDIPMVAEGARRQLVQHVADFRSLFDNMRLSLVNSAFFQGGVYADVAGNVLPTSSGATGVSVTFGVNSFTKNSTYLGGTTVGDWSSAGTDIGASLRALRDDSLQRTNYSVLHVLYGKSIPTYLETNTTIQYYLARNPQWTDRLLGTNEIPQGFFDYQWHPGYSSYFLDQNGATQKWCADNQIVVFPEIDENWYELIPGGTLVPNGIGTPGSNLDECLTKASIINGLFSYCEAMTVDPMQVKCITGLYCLPTIKVPAVVYSITVS